ncbi:MAG TPA: N-acetyltransferase [Bacillales bacterium]|nr:N-acetyltransferase [Bacillales bacterium]
MVQIRTEIGTDRKAVKEIHTLAFEQENEARLVDAIRESNHFIPELSLVAESEGEIVGHILFSRVFLETREQVVEILALAPMAVKPEYQNLGIGSRLVEEGLRACRETEFSVVAVLGHPEFYPRFGFVPARPQGLLPPFDVADEVFMVSELRPNKLVTIQGKVAYPPAFDGV